MKKIISILLVAAFVIAMSIPAFAESAAPRYSCPPCIYCGGQTVFDHYIFITVGEDDERGTGVIVRCTSCNMTMYAGAV